MLYNLHINQLAFSKFEKLDYRHAIIFDAIHKIFTTFSNIEKLDDWFWLSYDLLQDQLPLFRIGKDQLRILIKDLSFYNLIEINPENQKLAKTYFKLGKNAEIIFRPLEKNQDPSGLNSRPPLEKNQDNNIQKDNYQKEEEATQNFKKEYGEVQKPDPILIELLTVFKDLEGMPFLPEIVDFISEKEKQDQKAFINFVKTKKSAKIENIFRPHYWKKYFWNDFVAEKQISKITGEDITDELYNPSESTWRILQEAYREGGHLPPAGLVTPPDWFYK
jgi:hypothetical protein